MHFKVVILPSKLWMSFLASIFLSNTLCICTFGQMQVVDSAMHYLRSGQVREWSTFPADIEKKALNIQFFADANKTDFTLSLRQYDVKSDWNVFVNRGQVGMLTVDEKDMIAYFTVPAEVLVDGRNELNIRSTGIDSDDIKVGDIKIHAQPLSSVLSEATVELAIVDAGNSQPTASRITIVNKELVLQPVTSVSTNLAIRPGCVYTGNGVAVFSLPAGIYKIYAGRGFEYSIDSLEIQLKPGERIKKILNIRREVDTQGWISSDTHIHTYTYSKHGDATTDERAVTLAGEGIELPILTDHNIHVDLEPVAKKMRVDKYFTSVTGNEVTTKIGHFNVFKTNAREKVVNSDVNTWDGLVGNLGETHSERVVILNHAQDVHNGFRPFGSDRHLSSAGISKNDWIFPANAMEVMNSGSQQTQFMNLFHNWFGMLNHGMNLTPVGSSDSHDVNRFIVGQGRTYIFGDDNDPGSIDVDTTLNNFRDGKVMVSLGLLTKIIVNKRYGPGELVSSKHSATVELEVLGPSWVRADRIALYANGKKIREEKIDPAGNTILKWEGSWELPLPTHDIYLVAIAEGPGSGLPFWPIAKPYQQRSADWTPRLVGATGAVWIDADGNGKRDSAYDYAKSILNSVRGDVREIIKRLRAFDEAVAMQVAALLWKGGFDLNDAKLSNALKQASPQTKAGFEKIIQEIKLLK
jgi:hypothetical protein